MSEQVGPHRNDINQIFADPNLNEDQKWANSTFFGLEVIDYGSDTPEEAQRKLELIRNAGKRIIVHTKQTPNIPTLLNILYPADSMLRLAELLTNHYFEKSEILEGLKTTGLRFLSGKLELDIDKAHRELLVEYSEKMSAANLDNLISEIKSSGDLLSDEFEITRVFMDSKAGHPPSTLRNQTQSPDSVFVSAPVVDLVRIKDGEVDNNFKMTLPAKSLVYFGITSFNNCFITVEPQN